MRAWGLSSGEPGGQGPHHMEPTVWGRHRPSHRKLPRTSLGRKERKVFSAMTVDNGGPDLVWWVGNQGRE